MKSGRSMKEFLGVSTIHGFYYLGHAGSVGKAFWLVCVTVSISFAVTFNYLNIVDWLKNPSVVTTVEVIRSEVERQQNFWARYKYCAFSTHGMALKQCDGYMFSLLKKSQCAVAF